MAESRRAKAPKVEETPDNFPTIEEALRRVLKENVHSGTVVQSIEIQFGAAGDGTYRIREPRAEEKEGGVLSYPQPS